MKLTVNIEFDTYNEFADFSAKLAGTPTLAAIVASAPAAAPKAKPAVIDTVELAEDMAAAVEVAQEAAAKKAKAKAAPAPAAAPAPEPVEDAPELDYVLQVKPVAMRLAAKDRDVLKEILRGFGAATGTELPKEKLPQFLAQVKEALGEGA